MTEATSKPDPVYDRHGISVHHDSALSALSQLPDCSVDAVITDPPYGLGDHKPAAVITALTAWANGEREHVPDGKGFMGRDWDAFVPPPAVWDECLRVLKPGGHLAVFAGTRTVGLMDLSIRLAGFEIRDGLGVAGWVYGNGFPKSLDVSKAIDRAAGHVRGGYVDTRNGPNTKPGTKGDKFSGGYDNVADLPTEPQTPAARQWHGWGTALKPAWEPIILARKPLAGTVAATVLAHGTGAMNIGACRTRSASPQDEAAYRAKCASVVGLGSNTGGAAYGEWSSERADSASDQGRWPTNVLLTHHPDCGPDDAPRLCAMECHVTELDRQSDGGRAARPSGDHVRPGAIGTTGVYGEKSGGPMAGHNGSGASRFFPSFRWEAKAPTSERPQVDGVAHPTVKPVALMRWLVRLLTSPGGLVLDPFAGSGTTGQAARAEGMRAVLVEREADYIPLIKARLDARERTPAASTGVVSGDDPMDLLDLLNGEAS